jgi:flavin reductase (DIM6/NTAB) family NADH-FMN oxidoreductase RutF
MRLILDSIPPALRQQWLQHAVAPRPIGLVSTVDAAGRPNLSPFSFFNLFSTEPPVLVFSPARRLRDNTVKHTLANVLEVPECVIHIVDEPIVRQASLSSCEYAEGVDEAVMAGFTQVSSEVVRPPRIVESPIQMECRVMEVKPLGDRGGAGNLVICEVLVMHVADRILNDAGSMIDPLRLRHVARLGGDWYCRVDAQSLFEVEKPNQRLGIGFPGLPEGIRHSPVLTGDQLARLANVEALPEVDPRFDDTRVRHIIHYFSNNPEEMERELHRHAASLLDEGSVAEAWQVLLSA